MGAGEGGAHQVKGGAAEQSLAAEPTGVPSAGSSADIQFFSRAGKGAATTQLAGHATQPARVGSCMQRTAHLCCSIPGWGRCHRQCLLTMEEVMQCQTVSQQQSAVSSQQSAVSLCSWKCGSSAGWPHWNTAVFCTHSDNMRSKYRRASSVFGLGAAFASLPLPPPLLCLPMPPACCSSHGHPWNPPESQQCVPVLSMYAASVARERSRGQISEGQGGVRAKVPQCVWARKL